MKLQMSLRAIVGTKEFILLRILHKKVGKF